MTVPNVTIGLDSELTIEGTYVLEPQTTSIDPELFEFKLIEDATESRRLQSSFNINDAL